MDGNAEGYLIYGFLKMQGVTCQKGDVTLVIDLSDFGDADSAYGMFTSNVDGRQPTQKIGMNGQIVPRRAFFAKGRYFLEIGANPEGDHTPALQAWTAALDKVVPGSTSLPLPLAWFPAEQRQSLRLVPESVLGIRILKRGYAAQYDYGKAFVVQGSHAAIGCRRHGATAQAIRPDIPRGHCRRSLPGYRSVPRAPVRVSQGCVHRWVRHFSGGYGRRRPQ